MPDHDDGQSLARQAGADADAATHAVPSAPGPSTVRAGTAASEAETGAATFTSIRPTPVPGGMPLPSLHHAARWRPWQHAD
jgi:hypothetical protein